MNLTRARTVLLVALLIAVPAIVFALSEWLGPRSGSVWPP